MDDADYPVSSSEFNTIKELYVDASDFDEKKENVPIEPIDGPYEVVDPRYVGYHYLAYVFVETKESLGSAIDTNPENFPVDDRHKALMLGSCFGDFDIIHRRADKSQYNHADFTVRAKENKELDFFQGVETYPIFTVGRWHGQDVKGNMTLDNPPDGVDPLKQELIKRRIKNPNQSVKELRDDILEDIPKDSVKTVVDFEKVEEKTLSELRKEIKGLEEKILLGKSIGIKLSQLKNIGFHVLVGLTVEEREEGNSSRLPNESIMKDLMYKYDGWKMPYLVSGVGQNWADIIGEMYIDSPKEMNEISQEMRSVDGIKSTRTYLLTKTNFDRPLIINDPDDIISPR